MNDKIVKQIFSRFTGKYFIKRYISNYGQGQGIVHFIKYSKNKVLYREKLNINYKKAMSNAVSEFQSINYNQIIGVKEYLYSLEENKIIKYFINGYIVNSSSFAYNEQGAKREMTSNIVSEFKSIDYKEHHLFYQLNFININPIIAIANHMCNKDLYEASYIFMDEYNFNLCYKISGPEKNYTITTVFSKSLN